MNTTSPSSSPRTGSDDPHDRRDPEGSPRRALVIAGGGAAGNAWAIGVIAGLNDSGVDVTAADLVIGTSSGSTAAAQITGAASPAELYASILSEPARTRPRGHGQPGGGAPRSTASSDTASRGTRSGGSVSGISGQSYMDWSSAIIAASEDPADMRLRIGAASLERAAAEGVSSGAGGGRNRWRDIVAARLPGAHWPEQAVLITAVDARSGEPVVFDRDSGVDLVDAVAASTSPMIPYPIGERRYLNGSYRRGENADLAAGCERVLVLVPFGGRTRTPLEWGMDLATQVAELRAGGSRVETVAPDETISGMFDANALDPATRLPAARGGYEQGLALAGRIAELWG